MPEGYVTPRRINLVPDAHTPDARRWRDQHTTVRRVESSLQNTLLAAEDGDVWMRDYLRDWGAQVGRLDLSEAPPNMRGNSPMLDGRLADTAMSFYDGIPVTEPVKRPPAQVSSFKPRTVRDILYDWAIEYIEWWLRATTTQSWSVFRVSSGRIGARNRPNATPTSAAFGSSRRCSRSVNARSGRKRKI